MKRINHMKYTNSDFPSTYAGSGDECLTQTSTLGHCQIKGGKQIIQKNKMKKNNDFYNNEGKQNDIIIL